MTDYELQAISDNLIGMSTERARRLCEDHGWLLRVVHNEYGPQAGTCEYRPNRIHVVTNDDVVTEVCGRG